MENVKMKEVLERATAAASQNGRVWARRLEVEFKEDEFLQALKRAGFEGSVLRGPLTLTFFKKIGTMTWGKSLSRSDRQVLAKVAAFALTDVLRGHSSNALESLGHNARELGGSVLFASHSSALLEMVNKAIAARQVEKSRPNLANMVLGHIRRRDRQVNYIIGDDEDAGYM